MPKKRPGALKNMPTKAGRMKNKPAYKRYLAENRRMKNKARKLIRYMKKFPNWKPTHLSEDLSAMVKRS